MSVTLVVKRRPEVGQRFPFAPLPKAIERARELYKVANGHDVPFTTATKAWGYAEKSSGASQTAAALKSFGLLEDIGGADVRKVKLSDDAIKIIRDPRDISPDRDKLVRDAAMRPPIHKTIFNKYNGLPPSDEAFKAYLLLDLGLKDEVVSDFMREFAATMSYAKISDLSSIQDMIGLSTDPEEDAEETSSSANAPPAAAALPVSSALTLSSRLTAHPGQRQEVFGLDEGDVTLTFPANLSAASYEDLEDHLALFLRKAKRRVKFEANSEPSPASEE